MKTLIIVLLLSTSCFAAEQRMISTDMLEGAYRDRDAANDRVMWAAGVGAATGAAGGVLLKKKK